MLLYTVRPLPDNIIEYVWDFGALTDEDCSKYIHQMLLNSRSNNSRTMNDMKIIEMMKLMLIACHKYFKENEDSSSVSLRDVSRFIILYKFFKKSLNTKQEIARTSGL